MAAFLVIRFGHSPNTGPLENLHPSSDFKVREEEESYEFSNNYARSECHNVGPVPTPHMAATEIHSLRVHRSDVRLCSLE